MVQRLRARVEAVGMKRPTSSRAAFVIHFVQWCSVFLIYLASFAAISRLVDQDEIGLFGLAAAVYGILLMLGSFGVDRYLIQVRQLHPDSVGAAFGLSLVASVIGAALLLVLAGPLARTVYGDPRLAPVLQVFAVALLVTPVHATLQGLLQRSMLFSRLYAVNTGATIIGALTSVLLAWAGCGAVGLAWGMAADVVAKAAIAHAYRPSSVGGMAWPTRDVWQDATRFGGAALGVNLLTAISDAMPALLTGRMLGIDAVGLLNRAQRMVQLLQDAVQKSAKTVALPVLSAGTRTAAALRPAYLLKISYLSGLAWPVFLTIAVTAKPLVHLLLGPQWTEAVPVLRILALAGLLLPFSAVNISFFTVLERLDLMMKLQAWLLPLRLLILVAACLQGHLLTLAAAIVLVQACRAIVTSDALGRLMHLSLHATWVASSCSLLPAVATAATALTVLHGVAPALGPASSLAQAAAALALTWSAAGLVWLLAISFGRHPLRREFGLVRSWLLASVAARHARPRP